MEICSRFQSVCISACVRAGGGEALSKPMGVYIMFYGYEGMHKSQFH